MNGNRMVHLREPETLTVPQKSHFLKRLNEKLKWTKELNF